MRQDLGNRFRKQKGPAQVHSLSGAGADYRQGLSLYRRERRRGSWRKCSAAAESDYRAVAASPKACREGGGAWEASKGVSRSRWLCVVSDLLRFLPALGIHLVFVLFTAPTVGVGRHPLLSSLQPQGPDSDVTFWVPLDIF